MLECGARRLERGVDSNRHLQLLDGGLPELGVHVKPGEVITGTREGRSEVDCLPQELLARSPPPGRELVLSLEPERAIGARRFALERLIVRLIVVPRRNADDGPRSTCSDGHGNDRQAEPGRSNRRRRPCQPKDNAEGRQIECALRYEEFGREYDVRDWRDRDHHPHEPDGDTGNRASCAPSEHANGDPDQEAEQVPYREAGGNSQLTWRVVGGQVRGEKKEAPPLQ